MKNYLFFLIILICGSCEYDLKDDFFNDVDRNVDVPVSQVDLNFGTDTVYLNAPSEIRFRINALNHEFHWLKFYIDDVLNSTSESDSGTFIISPFFDSYNSGTHHIKIEAFSNSGTGSIADGIGVEGFLFTYTWVLIIDESKNLTPQIKKVSRDQGKLRLDWDLYRGMNFTKYVIRKTVDRNNWHTVTEVYDQNTLSAFDPSFVGEDAIFQILTYGNGVYYGQEVAYQDAIPQLRIENYGDKSFKLKWKTYFTDNIGGFIISSRAKGDWPNYQKIATLLPSDTSYIFTEGMFGTIMEIQLTTIPKQAPAYFIDTYYQQTYYSSKCEGMIGKKLSNTGPVYVPYNNFLIYRTDNWLFIYDYNARKNTDSLLFSNSFWISSVSPNGNYILGYENNASFFLYDVSGKTRKTISFSNITGSLKYYYQMAISNVGIAILVGDYDYFVYDFINDHLIATKDDFDYLPLNLTISADGKYFSNGYNYFFKIDGSTIQQLPSIANKGYYGFNPLNPEEVIEYTSNESLEFINILDGSISKSIPISCDIIHNIDFSANKILGSTLNELKVFELNTGNVLWTYPTFSQTGFIPYEFQLCKDAIYWDDGYLIYLQ